MPHIAFFHKEAHLIVPLNELSLSCNSEPFPGIFAMIYRLTLSANAFGSVAVTGSDVEPGSGAPDDIRPSIITIKDISEVIGLPIMPGCEPTRCNIYSRTRCVLCRKIQYVKCGPMLYWHFSYSAAAEEMQRRFPQASLTDCVRFLIARKVGRLIRYHPPLSSLTAVSMYGFVEFLKRHHNNATSSTIKM
jgi:hypothetical protein